MIVILQELQAITGKMSGGFIRMNITGHTGLLALIGSPVGHSGSPAMYNYSFDKLGLDYVYVAIDVKEDKVKDAIEAMKTFHMRLSIS